MSSLALEIRITGDTAAVTLARLPELLEGLAPNALFPGEWPRERSGGPYPFPEVPSRLRRKGVRRG